jgi:hypothetical protein
MNYRDFKSCIELKFSIQKRAKVDFYLEDVYLKKKMSHRICEST